MLRLWRTPYLFLKRGLPPFLPSFLPSFLPAFAIDGKNDGKPVFFRACIHRIFKVKSNPIMRLDAAPYGHFALRAALFTTLDAALRLRGASAALRTLTPRL
jgi:hypothetical protein